MSDKTEFSADIRVRIPAPWKQELIDLAEAENLDMSDIARRAIDQYLDAGSPASKGRYGKPQPAPRKGARK